MSNEPLVSIITPSYNQGRFIEDLILSVKHQDYPQTEHIIVDGGSTDNTLELLHKYSDCVKWISEPDKGFADAVNKGIRMTSGGLIAIQNSDDTYHSREAISKAVTVFKKNPSAGVIFGDSATIDQNGRVISSGEHMYQGYSLAALLCSEFVFPQGSAFISRAALDAIGGSLDVDVDWCADFDLWIRIGLKYPIIYVPSVFADYRIHPAHRNADVAYAKRNPEHRRRVLDKVFAMPDLPPGIQRLRSHAYAGTYLNQACRLAGFGLVREAVSSFTTAVELYPPYLFGRQVFAFQKRVLYGYLRMRLTEKQLAQLKHVRFHLCGRGSGTSLEGNKWWKQQPPKRSPEQNGGM